MCGITHLTHLIFGVDVGLGFEQYDGSIGIILFTSHHQGRPTMLRTHNGILRDRSEVCGHHSSDTHYSLGVDVRLGFEQ